MLESTQKAQKMQEEALDELRNKLSRYTTEIAEAQDALRKRDVALKLKEESDRMAATAVQSSQLCRQEAAAALQQKDTQMQQVRGESVAPMTSSYYLHYRHITIITTTMAVAAVVAAPPPTPLQTTIYPIS